MLRNKQKMTPLYLEIEIETEMAQYDVIWM